jgi:S1-C subfamily serine protease
LASLAAAISGPGPGPAAAQAVPTWSIEAKEGACVGVYAPPDGSVKAPARMFGFEWRPGAYLAFFTMDEVKPTQKEGDTTRMAASSALGVNLRGEGELRVGDGVRMYRYQVEDRKDAADLLAGDLTIALRDPGAGDLMQVLPLGRQTPRVRKCMAEAQEQTKQLAQAGGAAAAPRAAAPRTAAAEPEGPTMIGSGSGVFINAQGQLLTNAHVIDECRAVGNATIGLGKVIAVDAASDLAVLQFARTPRGFASMRSDTLRLGEGVIAAGYPLSGLLDNGLNVTSGNVSALSGIRGDRRFVQVTTPVQPGNSGGPLLDASGRMVGVISGGLKDEAVGEGHAQNVNYAVAPFVVQAFLQEHDVSFTQARPSRETTETIAAKARGHTVALECWS